MIIEARMLECHKKFLRVILQGNPQLFRRIDTTSPIHINEGVRKILEYAEGHVRSILRLRYGINIRFPHSIPDIARRMEISRNDVQSRLARAIRSLKNPTTRNILDHYLA